MRKREVRVEVCVPQSSYRCLRSVRFIDKDYSIESEDGDGGSNPHETSNGSYIVCTTQQWIN